MQSLCQNSVVKVSVESKPVVASAGGDMVWRKNATMNNEKMDENDPLCGGPGYQVQIGLGGNRE